MTQVSIAAGAEHLSPRHPERVVRLPRDVVPSLRLLRVKETRPSRARVKLGLCGEELGAAADAGVHPDLARVLVVFARPGSLSSVSSGHLILDAAQERSPLRVTHLLLRLPRLLDNLRRSGEHPGAEPGGGSL